MALTRLEKARAILRVAAEDLVPVAELRDAAGVSEQTLRSWIVDGRRGKHLDGLLRGGVAYSSRAALARFFAEYTPRSRR